MPKIVDHDEYRRELIEKCFSLLSRKGFSQVTMREIAAEIGVSTGTLYHYFPTKESILEQMFAFVRESNIADYAGRITEEFSLAGRLERVRSFWKESRETYQNTMLLAIDSLRNDPENSGKVFLDFSDYYTEAMAYNFGISRQFARSIFIYFLGLILHSIFTPRELSYDDQIDVITEILLSVLQEKGAPGEESARRLVDRILSILGDEKRVRQPRNEH